MLAEGINQHVLPPFQIEISRTCVVVDGRHVATSVSATYNTSITVSNNHLPFPEPDEPLPPWDGKRTLALSMILIIC
jgi:hypothetical protein